MTDILKAIVQARVSTPKGYDSGGTIWSKAAMEKRIGLMNLENIKLRGKINELEEKVKVLEQEKYELLKIRSQFNNARKHYVAFRKSFDVIGN